MFGGSEYLFYDREDGLIVTAAGRSIGHAPTLTEASEKFPGIYFMGFSGSRYDFDRVRSIAFDRPLLSDFYN